MTNVAAASCCQGLIQLIEIQNKKHFNSIRNSSKSLNTKKKGVTEVRCDEVREIL